MMSTFLPENERPPHWARLVETQFEAERLRGLEIDGQLKLRRILHWQIGRLGAAQYAVDISRCLLKLDYRIEAIRNQSARFGKKSQRIDRWQAQARGQCDNEVAISKSQSVRGDKNATILLASERGQPPLDLFCIMHIERHELDLERRGEGFGRFEEYNMGRGLRMPHEPDTWT